MKILSRDQARAKLARQKAQRAIIWMQADEMEEDQPARDVMEPEDLACLTGELDRYKYDLVRSAWLKRNEERIMEPARRAWRNYVLAETQA